MLAGMAGLGAQGACCCWTVPFIMAVGAADGAELGFEKDFGSQWFALACMVLSASTELADSWLEIKGLFCV